MNGTISIKLDESVVLANSVSIYEDSSENLLHLVIDDADIPLTPTSCSNIRDACERAMNSIHPAVETYTFEAYGITCGKDTTFQRMGNAGVQFFISALGPDTTLFRITVVVIDLLNKSRVAISIFTEDAMNSFRDILHEHGSRYYEYLRDVVNRLH